MTETYSVETDAAGDGKWPADPAPLLGNQARILMSPATEYAIETLQLMARACSDGTYQTVADVGHSLERLAYEIGAQS